MAALLGYSLRIRMLAPQAICWSGPLLSLRGGPLLSLSFSCLFYFVCFSLFKISVSVVSNLFVSGVLFCYTFYLTLLSFPAVFCTTFPSWQDPSLFYLTWNLFLFLQFSIFFLLYFKF